MLAESEKRPFAVAILTSELFFIKQKIVVLKDQSNLIKVSDRVSQRLVDDRSGPALEALFSDSQTWRIRDRAVEPDDVESIQRTVRLWSTRSVDLILTTGGTGFSPRDVTPEAIEPLLQRKAPGFVHAMLSSSLKVTPLAALSRPVCGTIGQSLIVTLPGSSKGAVENLSAILSLLPHALELNRGGQGAGEAFHKRIHGGHGSHVCRHDPVSQDAMDYTSPAPEGVAHRSRKSKYPLLSYDEALQKVMKHSLQLEPVDAPVDSSLLGYVIAEDVFAPDAIPNFRASIVDGYAVICKQHFQVAGHSG